MRLLGYPLRFLRCSYAVAKVLEVVARLLLRYPEWFSRCCYAVARGTQGGC